MIAITAAALQAMDDAALIALLDTVEDAAESAAYAETTWTAAALAAVEARFPEMAAIRAELDRRGVRL